MSFSRRFTAALLTGAALLGATGASVAGDPAVDPFVRAVRVAQRPDYGGVPATRFATDQVTPVGVAAGLPSHGDSNPIVQVSGWGYEPAPGVGWRWEVLPDGLIYRSYLAGPRESRMALHTFHNDTPVQNSEYFWDATLGGRTGVLRFGNGDAANPIGWQLDIEGAAVVRLNLDEARDVDASDFRFGVPLTYTAGDGVAYKFGYYHVSSHLGDELIARTGVNNRINYVRDSLILGASAYVTPSVRVYGETAFAFFTAGGAEPWEFQFGAEWARPGPTGFAGTPFLATNAHLLEELDFGGTWTLQTGWLWRGVTGKTFRLGFHYLNGKSNQFQFLTRNEEQVGFGVWYDF